MFKNIILENKINLVRLVAEYIYNHILIVDCDVKHLNQIKKSSYVKSFSVERHASYLISGTQRTTLSTKMEYAVGDTNNPGLR